ncbi:MAG: cyclopropane-fatty-acyl-phospholipid synthase family protein [Pseudomonadota bacterium]
MFPLSKLLSQVIRIGTLNVTDAEGVTHAFSGSTDGPTVTMKLDDATLYRSLFFNPELAAGEAYMDGTLTFPGSSLREFLELLSINRNLPTTAPKGARKAAATALRQFKRFQQSNPIGKAQQNIAHHYDIGNALYKLFLDEGMFYSCAYFENDDDTLEDAQRAKCRLIASKLDLAQGQKILDIGSGWGGLAIYLAQMEEVEVLGVTLSKEQHALSVENAEAAGVADRVTFELRDYRELDTQFDRIVSVGMFEHVGVPRYDEFFSHINQLMPDDGVMLLHSIGHMSPPSMASPWMRKYIFPGAYSPALSEVFPVVERNRLWVTDCEFLRLHYAMTLNHWHQRFEDNRDEIARMFDDRFCRMWEFYLISAEMMFRTGAQEVFHMQLSRNRDASPIRRDYIFEAQARLREREAALGLDR